MVVPLQRFLTTIIKDVLCRSGLDLLHCLGQAYDGSSNMSGRISGVQARINPKAVFIHCVCHSLNLAVQDSFLVLEVLLM